MFRTNLKPDDSVTNIKKVILLCIQLVMVFLFIGLYKCLLLL